jgi:hypothetical protein
MTDACQAPGGCGYRAARGETLCKLHLLDRECPGWRMLDRAGLDALCRKVWGRKEGSTVRGMAEAPKMGPAAEGKGKRGPWIYPTPGASGRSGPPSPRQPREVAHPTPPPSRRSSLHPTKPA